MAGRVKGRKYPFRYWTSEEIQTLIRLIGEGLNCRQIGEQMGRSIYSIGRQYRNYKDLAGQG